VLVSGGGSAAGLPLARLAVAAAALTPGLRWRVLLGHGVPAAEMAALAGGAAIIERARPDFASLLSRASVSVSQAGYNTVLDLAAAGVPAVLVPFAEGGEREQGIRAAALAAQGLARVLPLEDLTAPALAQAAQAAAAGPRPAWSGIAQDGAARSVPLIQAEAAAARARDAAWRRLEAALAARDATLPVWLRDDDATAPTPELAAFLERLAAHGLPVIASELPSIRDVLRETGSYCDSKNAAEFAAQAIKLHDNPTLYIQTSLATYQRAGELSWPGWALKLLNFAASLKTMARQ
jgi:hypothetical protein